MAVNDDRDDIAWTGRPQDEPKLVAALREGRRVYRLAHPPTDCWIDCVQTIELYQGGRLRARVDRNRALISYMDEAGEVVSTAIYLGSENPYDVAETHLGIDRVTEIHDESAEAEERLSSYPRDREEQDTQYFVRRYGDPEDEIFHYLRSAVSVMRFEMKSGHVHYDLSPLLSAITSAALSKFEAALAQVKTAIRSLEERETDLTFALRELSECRRAMVALERYIAIQNRPPAARWNP